MLSPLGLWLHLTPPPSPRTQQPGWAGLCLDGGGDCAQGGRGLLPRPRGEGKGRSSGWGSPCLRPGLLGCVRGWGGQWGHVTLNSACVWGRATEGLLAEMPVVVAVFGMDFPAAT